MHILLRLPTMGLCAVLAACSDNAEPPTPAPVTANAPAVAAPVPAQAPLVASAPAAPTTAATAPAAVTEPAAEPPVPAPTPAPAAPDELTAGAALAYAIECPAAATAAEQCQVDKDTYIGWRTFAGQCQVCHGGSALGSTFAPNLLDRFHQRVDYARFVEVVRNGYRGQVGAMPGWKGNPNVEPHIDAIYRYLKARADGALPPGRPARKL